jgi:hypothetical protein
MYKSSEKAKVTIWSPETLPQTHWVHGVQFQQEAADDETGAKATEIVFRQQTYIKEKG